MLCNFSRRLHLISTRVADPDLVFQRDVPVIIPKIKIQNFLNTKSIGDVGGGGNTPWDAKFIEKCPCSYSNNTAFIKQI